VRRLVQSLLLLLLATSLAAKDKEFTPPPVFHARVYAAHDEHANEHVIVAADAYGPGKAGIFTTDYNALGFLPLRIIISNDSGQIITLKDMKLELDMHRRHKREPSSEDDILRRLAEPPDRGGHIPLPIPLPKRKGNPKLTRAQNEIEAAQMKALAVEPGKTAAGFAFFDVAGLIEPLEGATLYVSGLRDADGKELFYFEIPLTAAAAKSP
jgi:hypothetical protein